MKEVAGDADIQLTGLNKDPVVSNIDIEKETTTTA